MIHIMFHMHFYIWRYFVILPNSYYLYVAKKMLNYLVKSRNIIPKKEYPKKKQVSHRCCHECILDMLMLCVLSLPVDQWKYCSIDKSSWCVWIGGEKQILFILLPNPSVWYVGFLFTCIGICDIGPANRDFNFSFCPWIYGLDLFTSAVEVICHIKFWTKEKNVGY